MESRAGSVYRSESGPPVFLERTFYKEFRGALSPGRIITIRLTRNSMDFEPADMISCVIDDPEMTLPREYFGSINITGEFDFSDYWATAPEPQWRPMWYGMIGEGGALYYNGSYSESDTVRCFLKGAFLSPDSIRVSYLDIKTGLYLEGLMTEQAETLRVSPKVDFDYALPVFQSPPDSDCPVKVERFDYYEFSYSDGNRECLLNDYAGALNHVWATNSLSEIDKETMYQLAPFFTRSCYLLRRLTILLNYNGFVTLQCFERDYGGGAHGHHYTQFINFDRIGNDVLEWDQIIRPECGPELEAICKSVIERNNPDSEPPGQTCFFMAEEFAVIRNGLLFQYQSFEVMSNMCGVSWFFVSYKEIANLLTPWFANRINLSR
jgi:hypothetical protein